MTDKVAAIIVRELRHFGFEANRDTFSGSVVVAWVENDMNGLHQRQWRFLNDLRQYGDFYRQRLAGR